MTIQEKINALMEREAFAEAFNQAASPEEVVALFGANGIEVPLEIATELFEQPQGELDEEALDNVAGGGVVGVFIGKVVVGGAYYGAGYLGGRLAGWDKARSSSYAKSCSKFGSSLGGILGGLAIPV